jgi:hypothetical protein
MVRKTREAAMSMLVTMEMLSAVRLAVGKDVVAYAATADGSAEDAAMRDRFAREASAGVSIEFRNRMARGHGMANSSQFVARSNQGSRRVMLELCREEMERKVEEEEAKKKAEAAPPQAEGWSEWGWKMLGYQKGRRER